MLVWTDEYNKRRKAHITKKEIAKWDIPTILPITPNQVYRYFTYVWKYRWREIPPTEPEIGEVTKRIHRKGYRISIITKREDRKSTRLNSSHANISYAVFCLKKKKNEYLTGRFLIAKRR